MKDVAGLLHLTYRLAHEVSEAGLDMERAPNLRPHRTLANQAADAGVSALAHVAAASGDWSPNMGYRERAAVELALRGARGELRQMTAHLKMLRGRQTGAQSQIGSLIARVDELTVVLMATAVAVRGNRLVA